jgi:hypothetical protein
VTIDRLFVIWGALSDRGRHVVGHLARDRVGGPYRFWYEADLSAAFAQGFVLFPTFPEPRVEASPYAARYLFATFADRIPSAHRLDRDSVVATWGVERPDDQFELLAKSGGLRATDRIELAEYRAPEDPLIKSLEFRVAGARYVPTELRATLAAGDSLRFEREPTNKADPAATIVATTTDGKRAGYVPRQYSRTVARLLDTGVLLGAVAVREIIVPDDAGRWVVRASRARE